MNDKLQQAKDLAAKEYGYESFEQFDDKSTFGYDHRTPEIIQRIAERYHALMSEWISVDDRLPEKGERVLIAHDDFGVQIAYLTMDDLWMIIAFQIKAKFNDHWKPLPNLPQPPKQ